MGSLSMSSAVRLWLVSVDARADGMTSVTWTDSASRPGSISTLTPTIPPSCTLAVSVALSNPSNTNWMS